MSKVSWRRVSRRTSPALCGSSAVGSIPPEDASHMSTLRPCPSAVRCRDARKPSSHPDTNTTASSKLISTTPTP
ncbi:hypothetical protein O159_14200 [Leifsonia xyli subsp. cynodontis DSM 46306]|uniref:Uncharacterized protein n=1 Tax=Leifsonia xyli subsp. cynodontis DSM 46306 TaxID=1389489 RepID=U3PD86_LEIXC|nr:hypothetical protein O159_14200 [Leifsonia xyli subsp. cynodontis DSM 46306]